MITTMIAHDVLGAAVDRQHVHEIKNKNNDHKGDQNADERGHGRSFRQICRSALKDKEIESPAPSSGRRR